MARSVFLVDRAGVQAQRTLEAGRIASRLHLTITRGRTLWLYWTGFSDAVLTFSELAKLPVSAAFPSTCKVLLRHFVGAAGPSCYRNLYRRWSLARRSLSEALISKKVFHWSLLRQLPICWALLHQNFQLHLWTTYREYCSERQANNQDFAVIKLQTSSRRLSHCACQLERFSSLETMERSRHSEGRPVHVRHMYATVFKSISVGEPDNLKWFADS